MIRCRKPSVRTFIKAIELISFFVFLFRHVDCTVKSHVIIISASNRTVMNYADGTQRDRCAARMKTRAAEETAFSSANIRFAFTYFSSRFELSLVFRVSAPGVLSRRTAAHSAKFGILKALIRAQPRSVCRTFLRMKDFAK